ncbi:response regulator transcription factor [Thiohalocapsa marina]|uniref:Response regulator transcription factor n=1 Tax=Thiohalocapsa marina TaxID=424902 RepID=A0A5M8FHY9_9GAMM|nr:response regulator transcription factor [Thiohalocapsa marina]KAA6184044.1 response regulator transcription factor [Thiohalocapsa marina]
MSAEGARLLLVDDDAPFRSVLARSLTRRGFDVTAAGQPEQALACCAAQPPAYVILDLNLDGQSGLNLIQPLLELAPDARILILTGYASIPTVVSAMKLGAVHYLAKPADVADILRALTEEPPLPAATAPVPDRPLSVRHLEWEYIQRTLDAHDGNITATARALGMHRRTLQRKLGKRRPTACPPLPGP